MALSTSPTIELHRALELMHECQLILIGCCRGTAWLCKGGLIALEVDPRALQLRFIARELSHGLIERRLIGARIDLGTELALLLTRVL